MEKLIIEKSNGARAVVFNGAKAPETFLDKKYLRKEEPKLISFNIRYFCIC